MFVGEIMTKNVHTVTPETTLGEVRNIFKQVGYRHLLVEQDGKLVGVISDRDVLARSSPWLDTQQENNRDRDSLNVPAATFMNTNVITVDRQTIVECASILLIENNISCLPVVKQDNAIDGILSWKDLLQYSIYGAEHDPVSPKCE